MVRGHGKGGGEGYPNAAPPPRLRLYRQDASVRARARAGARVPFCFSTPVYPHPILYLCPIVDPLANSSASVCAHSDPSALRLFVCSPVHLFRWTDGGLQTYWMTEHPIIIRYL